MKTVGSAAVVGAVAPAFARFAHAAPATKATATTAVQHFYQTLSEKQLLSIAFPFDHELRKKINANWHITKPTIGDDFYTKEQRELMKDIVRNITSEDGFERLMTQMDDDAGGFEKYSVAVFGEPGKGKFEWELTGRHLTLRADGDSVDKTAFGGPIVYGHGEESPADNMYHNHTKQLNEVFKALDEKHAKKALLQKAPNESAVKLQGPEGKFPGLAIGELASDQKELVEKSLKTLLSPYRQEDVAEVMSILKAGGGLDKLRMAFYQQEPNGENADLDNDKVWDIWRLEGPSFVWHFRGAPHVHAYINISEIV